MSRGDESATLAALRARPLATLVLVAAAVSFTGIGNELWSPDEPRVAEIGRAMWQSGEWVLPRLSGRAFVEKPPLYWWAQVGVFTLAGEATAPLARLPSALFSFAAVLLTYAFGRRWFAPEACLLGGLILLSMNRFALVAHWIVVDSALVFGVTGTWACLVHALERQGRARSLLLAGVYGFAALAFFAKGVVGLGMPAVGALVYLIWSGRLRDFLGWHLVAGALFVFGLAGWWFIRVAAAGGGAAVEEFFVYNQLGRFLGAAGGFGAHLRPITYYLVSAPGNWLPWTPFLLLAGVALWRSRHGLDERTRDGVRACVAAIVPVFIVLSLASSKRALYLVPVYPAVALLIGAWMTGTGENGERAQRLERAARVLLLVGVGVVACAAFIDPAGWPQGFSGAAVLAVGAAILARPWPEDRSGRWIVSAVLVALATLNCFTVFKPMFDRTKPYVDFTDDVTRFVPGDGPVSVLRASDTTIGAIGFYTGRPVRYLGFEELAPLAESAQESYVVVRDRREARGYYSAIVEAGIPHRVLSVRLVDGRRPHRILALGGASTPAPVPGDQP